MQKVTLYNCNIKLNDGYFQNLLQIQRSIVFERKPTETNIMNRKLRNIKEDIVDKSILIKDYNRG